MNVKNQCPNCRSFKVAPTKGTYIVGGIIGVIFTSPWFFVFPFIALIFFLASLGVIGLGLAQKKGNWKCTPCGNNWIPNPNE